MICKALYDVTQSGIKMATNPSYTSCRETWVMSPFLELGQLWDCPDHWSMVSVMPSSRLCPGFMWQAASWSLSLGSPPSGDPDITGWKPLDCHDGKTRWRHSGKQHPLREEARRPWEDCWWKLRGREYGRCPSQTGRLEEVQLFWCRDGTLGNTVTCSNMETKNIPDEFIDFSKEISW